MDLKKDFKTLVETVKYLKTIETGKTFTNEDVANAMELEEKYFNSLVGKNGKVLQKHIDTLRSAFPILEKGLNHTEGIIIAPHHGKGPKEDFAKQENNDLLNLYRHQV